MESKNKAGRPYQDDPLVDIPPEFPTTHSRFPTVPSIAFEESIRNAEQYEYEPEPASSRILELLGIDPDKK